jgi:hypothetical protein
MPAQPKSKPTHVLVWNRGGPHEVLGYRNGVVTLNQQDAATDGRPHPVLTPLRPGLDLSPTERWERAEREAKAGGPRHQLSKMLKSGRLSVVDLHKMPEADGSLSAPEAVQAHAVEVKRTWGRKDQSRTRKITAHFASFSRASEA